MSVSYGQSLQNSRMDLVLAAIDGNAAPASLEICTSGYASILVSIPLADPSFSRAGSKPNTALTLLSTPRSANAAASGTAALGRLKDGGGTVIADGLTVNTSGADIILNSVSIVSGQQVSVSSGVLTHSA